MDNDCTGCNIKGKCGHERHGDYIRQGKLMRCPCRDCIVKVMCESMCHELRKYKVLSCDYWNMPKTYRAIKTLDNLIRQEANI